MHLKQSSFLNNSFWIESRFDLLSFFHEETDDVSRAVNMLKTEQAAWVADALMTDRAFNSVNLTLTCMQMSTNSFKFVICSLSVARWRSELILCWRSSSKVSLLYSSFALNLWNFIQNSWKKILFWYSFKYCRWVVWWWLKSSYILLIIDSTSSTSRNEFKKIFCMQEAMCLIAASLTRLSMYAIFNSSIEKWFLFVFSLFCIQDSQLFTFCVESSNRDESSNLINFENQSSEIKVLCWLDAASRWCIITFLSLFSFCRRVCVIFNMMFISLTSSNIWIMLLWISISMSCCWHMYLTKTTMSFTSWVFIQAFNSVLMLILIISWSKNNAFMFFSSVFNDTFVSSSSEAVQFCDRSDSLLAFWSL